MDKQNELHTKAGVAIALLAAVEKSTEITYKQALIAGVAADFADEVLECTYELAEITSVEDMVGHITEEIKKSTPAPATPETDVQNEDYSISSKPNIPPRYHKVKPRLVAKDPCKDCAQARPGGCPYTCAARNRYIAAVERYYSKTMLDV